MCGNIVRANRRALEASAFWPEAPYLAVVERTPGVGRAARCSTRMGRYARSSEWACVLHVLAWSPGAPGAAYGSFAEDGAAKQRKCLSKWRKSRGGPGLKTPDSLVMPQWPGGEWISSKVIRDGSFPPAKDYLLRNLECQGDRGVRGERNFGEPCGQARCAIRHTVRFLTASG